MIITKQIEQIISTGFLTPNDILALFTKFRILIERENKPSEYNVLKFYCDWALHHQIDRSVFSIQVLEKISIMLYDHDNKNVYTDKVQEFISIAALRKEIIHILLNHNIDFTFILNDELWYKVFVILLVNHLLERPIKLPIHSKKKYNAVYNDILKKVNDKPLYVVREFSFIKYEGKICWKLKTENDYIDIIGPLQFDKKITKT